MTKYLFLSMGIWCLYHAWSGIVPQAGATQEIGERMSGSTRVIFAIGGAMLTGLGIILWQLH